MSHDPIAARYAQALFETAKGEGTSRETAEQLARIGGLLRDHPDLKPFVNDPHVALEDRLAALDRLLEGSWSGLVRAGIRLVIAMGRAALLSEIVEAFQAAVEADEGRLRVVVRSAHPVPEPLLLRLQAQLAKREQKLIALETELAPELVGGVQIVLGHRLIDGSIQRQLHELRERLQGVRVH